MTYLTGKPKTIVEGKIFYEYGLYNINIPSLDSKKTEQIIKALKGIVQLRRIGYGG